MKKKIISLLMALCMLTTIMTVCSVNAFAEEISNSFFSQKVRARAGETVTVTFSASTTDDFACLIFTPEYDYTAYIQ